MVFGSGVYGCSSVVYGVQFKSVWLWFHSVCMVCNSGVYGVKPVVYICCAHSATSLSSAVSGDYIVAGYT